MKIQKIILGSNKCSWLVLDDNYLPIPIIQNFIRYITNIEKSPNTIRAYAHHLKLYWQFLKKINKGWDNITLSDLAEFVCWLRTSDNNVIVLDETVSTRRETTINSILAALSTFYRYNSQIGKTNIQLISQSTFQHKRYKSLLHHITKSKPTARRIIKLKPVVQIPKTLSHEQVDILFSLCFTKQDKFLIALLYETGMRIGQALGLHHEDIHSWNNDYKNTRQK